MSELVAGRGGGGAEGDEGGGQGMAEARGG